ncbi:MAG: Stk1 family PASTA domain-containing Ser/Thr kinase [Chloroflexi bacterium]|nr:Stk1 family PASTA domain-containing Ser/Thr kinase [Chloroflexota bacterium]
MADVGHVLGSRYALVEMVGQGGMATIYRGRDTKLGRDVAIKVLRGEYGSDASFLARFQREAQAAAQLNHPNVVAVFDYGQDPVGPYIVMELVTGGDLAGALRERGPLPPTVATSLGQQIADALHAAHARGIVHRDIKPSNVLLSTGGRVKVADFGIAQAFTDAQLTMTGVTMGSVHYFSPEQAKGEPVTSASDIYSAGLVLYEMLTGQRAYSGGTAAEVAMARLSGRIPSPVEQRPDVPAALDAIVRWCLQPDPRARPAAADLASALGRFLADPYGSSSYPAVSQPTPATRAAATTRTGTATRSGPRSPTPPTGHRQAVPVSDPGGGGRLGWAAILLGLFVLVVAGVLLFLALLSDVGRPAPTTGPATPTPTATPRPTQLAVPRFVGLPVTTAIALADQLGLDLDEERRQTDEAAPGTVIDQRPAPGTMVSPGRTVSLIIAQQADTAIVPDVRGDTEAAARTRIVEAGLVPSGRFRAYDPEIAEGRVVRTDPRAGAEVAARTTVALYVSRGPRPTPQPTPEPTPVLVGRFLCLDVAQARAGLEEVDLVIESVDPPPPESDDSWLVRDQDPPAGSEVPPGTSVRLWVTDPAEPCNG